MLPFHHKILLRPFHTRKLVDNSMFLQKIRNCKLLCIIESDLFYGFPKLSLNELKEIHQQLRSLKFICHQAMVKKYLLPSSVGAW